MSCAGTKERPTTGQGGNGNNTGGGGAGLGIGNFDAAPPPVDGTSINTAKCGNGELDTANGEQCDDGNTTPGDGCSRICQIAAGWECPTPGQPCRLIAKCGDGKLTSNEVCDDGNTADGDGCKGDCSAIDPGYACRVPGRKCVPACGDGKIIMGKEGCDDGNTTADDGCSPTCVIEPGASCDNTTPPSKCTASVCGNGKKETGEGCDCGTDPKSVPTGCPGPNGLFVGDGTGCSKTCTQEPICRGAATAMRPASGTTRACNTACGNGNIEAGEECDDANLAKGDGCDDLCKKEAGFTCTPQMRPDTEPCTAGGGDCLKLPVVYRDFKNENVSGGHPDFFYMGASVTGGPSIPGVKAGNPPTSTQTVNFNKRYCVPNSGGPAKGGDSTARCWGIMGDNLDAKGKPAFNATRTGGNLCDCQFTDWSHNDNGGHVPGYGDAGSAGHILNGLVYARNPASDTGAPFYSGQAPIVKDATSVGQWFSDSTFSTRSVGLLDMPAAGGGQYQFLSAAHAVYGGFFPLDPPGQFPAAGSTAGPGAIKTVMGTNEAMLCNLWPYWFSSATFGAGAGCKGDQYLFPPSVTPSTANPNGQWALALQGWYHNFWFTSEARYLFNFSGAFSAQFFGDDDLFIYINGHLMLDLGGVHQRLPGRVSIDATGAATITEGGALDPNTNMINACPGPDPYTKTVTVSPADCRNRTMTAALTGLEPGKTYEIAVFHADRHPSESNYQLTLSGFSTTRSNCGPTCGDGVATGAEECDCGAMTASSDPLCGGMTNNDTTYGGCTTQCKYGPYCGDGMMNGPEECDLGSKMNTSSYGAQGCTPGCTKPHYCGDGLVDEGEGEQCDLGSNNGMPDQQCNTKCQIIFG